MKIRNAHRRRNTAQRGLAGLAGLVATLTVALAVGTLTSLAVGVGGAAAQETDEQKQDEANAHGDAPAVFVTVENNNWSDMRLYALRNGIRYRLGTVVSFTKERFALPRHLQPDHKPVQLLADPIGGRRSVKSYPVYLSSGEELIWALQNNLALSGVIVN